MQDSRPVEFNVLLLLCRRKRLVTVVLTPWLRQLMVQQQLSLRQPQTVAWHPWKISELHALWNNVLY